MSTTNMTQIIDQCFRMDSHANRLYTNLARNAGSQELKVFWQDIATQNETHLIYWNRMQKWAGKGILNNLFDDSRQVLKELTALQEKVHDLADGCLEVRRKEKAFTMAFKLEFYLLHPAFETLSQYVATFNGSADANSSCERFVSRLFDALQQNELSTLELELVGEVIHRLWKENRRMAFLSNYDELTGVFNRRGLFNAITHIAHLAQRNGHTVSALMIDIDRFKAVNDTYGHQFGDEVLRRVADCIRESIRASDVLGRYGGEEFAILVPETTGPSALILANDLRSITSEERWRCCDVDLQMTISIGIAEECAEMPNHEALLKKADEALYEAKAGRNRAILYD